MGYSENIEIKANREKIHSYFLLAQNMCYSTLYRNNLLYLEDLFTRMSPCSIEVSLILETIQIRSSADYISETDFNACCELIRLLHFTITTLAHINGLNKIRLRNNRSGYYIKINDSYFIFESGSAGPPEYNYLYRITKIKKLRGYKPVVLKPVREENLT